MWHAWESRGKCTSFWWEIPKERDHSEDQGGDGRIGSETILGRLAGGVCGMDQLVQDSDRWRTVVVHGHGKKNQMIKSKIKIFNKCNYMGKLITLFF
jgi:hypothetical protein